MAAPDLSIIVPFFNRRSEVEPCLSAVVAQELSGGRSFEVIAVDNGSTDGTVEALQAWSDVSVVHCGVRGPAAARNAGVAAARAPVVVFTDSDCVPHAGWLEALTEPFADPDMLLSGGEIRARSTRRGVACYAEFSKVLNNEKFYHGWPCVPPFFATANAAFRKDAFLAVGGFDERLMIGEDADLCWRVLDLGGRMAFCPDAVVDHSHRETFSGFFRQAIGYGRGTVDVFAKHRHRMGARHRMTWENVCALARLLPEIPARLLLGRTAYQRKSGVYDVIWRTGLMLGHLQGSLRHRLFYF